MSENRTEILNKKRKKFYSKKRKTKLSIVFDENARREFLTGFHKRKLQRKNIAKKEFEEQLKAERKRIRAEAKEQYMKLLLSQKPIPELHDLKSENIDMGTHSVTVTELSTADLARKNNWIGLNEVQYQAEEGDEESDESDEKNGKELEGMGVKKNKGKIESYSSKIVAKSCKDVKKKIKQQATENVKNSKIFQKKAKMEKIKNIKLKRKHEKRVEKIKKKGKRNKLKKKNTKCS